MSVIAGIFIGGAATRYGGIAKGLLDAPDGSGPLIERLHAILSRLGISAVLVGPHCDDRYKLVGLPTVFDRGRGMGPLGGFLSIFDHAIAEGHARVLALACDMPFVSGGTIERLVAVDAPVAAARRAGRWEPFLSVHDARVMRARAEANAAAGRFALQALFDGAIEVPVDPRELEDWDSPADRLRTTR